MLTGPHRAAAGRAQAGSEAARAMKSKSTGSKDEARMRDRSPQAAVLMLAMLAMLGCTSALGSTPEQIHIAFAGDTGMRIMWYATKLSRLAHLNST